MPAEYAPQILVRDGVERVANSKSQQIRLEFDGYALKGKEATSRNTTAAQRDAEAPRPVTAAAKAEAAAAKEPTTAGTNGKE